MARFIKCSYFNEWRLLVLVLFVNSTKHILIVFLSFFFVIKFKIWPVVPAVTRGEIRVTCFTRPLSFLVFSIPCLYSMKSIHCIHTWYTIYIQLYEQNISKQPIKDKRQAVACAQKRSHPNQWWLNVRAMRYLRVPMVVFINDRRGHRWPRDGHRGSWIRTRKHRCARFSDEWGRKRSGLTELVFFEWLLV